MAPDQEYAIAVRRAWMDMGATLPEFAYADVLLGRVSDNSGLAPQSHARILLGKVPRWIAAVGRILERSGPTIAVVAMMSWFASGFDEHPGYLGLGGLLALAMTWILSKVLAGVRSPGVAWTGFLLLITVPALLGLEFPGPDVGIPLIPVWLALPLGLAGGCVYLFRLVCSVSPSAGGFDTLQSLWRASGTSEDAVAEMTEELANFEDRRKEEGRPITEEEWLSEGLVIDYPEEADPHRRWRLLAKMAAAFIAVVSMVVLLDVVTSGATQGVIDGGAIGVGCLVVALISLPAVVLVRRGRLLMVVVLSASMLGALVVPLDAVVARIDPFWALVALVASGAVLLVRLPRTIRELIDRLL